MAGEQGLCRSQELGGRDGGWGVTATVKASVMFTKVFWEHFAWEHLRVDSDTQAARARGTCRSSRQVPLGTGVSTQPLPCCKVGEKQSSTAECRWGGSKLERGWSCPSKLPAACWASGQGTPFPLFAAMVRSQPDRAQQEGEGVTLLQRHTPFSSQLLEHTYAPEKYKACRQLEGEGTDF